MDNKKFVTAVILAAGIGSRMRSDITKQRMLICGESVLRRCVRAFDEAESIDAIVVVCKSDERDFALSETSDLKKVVSIVDGGNTRAESAKLGFFNTPNETEYVAIHDGVRCLATSALVDQVVNAAFIHGAATAARKITDTVKRVNSKGYVFASVPREDLYTAETPQVFKAEDYAEGLKMSSADSSVTDDNMIIENIGKEIFCVESGIENIKITVPGDIPYAEFLIKRRELDG